MIRAALVLSCATVLLACGDGAATIQVEAFSPASRTGKLTQYVGVGLGEPDFAPVLEPPCELPCEETASFTTVEDNQEEIVIELFRGKTTSHKDARYLGTFLVTGLAHMPADEPDVVVTFRADLEGLSLSAVESTGVPVQLVKESR